MFEYIIGKITDIASNYIVLENNNIGYKLYTSSPYSFNINEEYKVYIYQHVREDENTLFGFKLLDDKALFLKLIDVKGLGPKMTLPMLASGSSTGIIDAIEREDILYLKKFPKIGEKIAKQIILDLKGKLVSKTSETNYLLNKELMLALQALGYKNSDINKIINKIDITLKIEDQIKEALKLLLK